MVLLLNNHHVYNHNFETSTTAYLNRYPNPFAKHVLSCDTLECFVDDQGHLRLTRFIVKTGRLPKFIKPLLGSSLNSCIIEKMVINPKLKKMLCYTSNVDHTKFIKIEEYLNYSILDSNTLVKSKVKFSSNLIGFKQKIENWSHQKFNSNMKNTVNGLNYVMNQFKNRKSL